MPIVCNILEYIHTMR